MSRIDKFRSETAKFPNFITVDFYNIGNCFENVNKLNQVEDLALPDIDLNERVKLLNNPLTNNTIVQMPKISKAPFYTQLYSFNGTKVRELPLIWESQFQFDINNLTKGIYLILITDVKQCVFSIKVVVN